MEIDNQNSKKRKSTYSNGADVPLDDRRLIVRNLPFVGSTEEISTKLSGFGAEKVLLPLKSNGRTKGFGFLIFSSPSLAQQAKEKVDGAQLFDRIITAEFTQQNDKYSKPAPPSAPHPKKPKTSKDGEEEEGEEENGEGGGGEEEEEISKKELKKIDKKRKQKEKEMEKKLQEVTTITTTDENGNPLNSKQRKALKLKAKQAAKKLAAKTKKDNKVAVLQYNKTIVEHGIRKEFTQAMKSFVRLRRRGLQPTVYTYSSIINACVRCGEIDKAYSLLKQMKNDGVKPNEVVYTVAIKGVSQTGRMTEAAALIDEMSSEGVPPNLRTINTFLRGCLRWGEVEMAESIFEMLEQLNLQPDQSSFEYLLKCYCQAMKLDKAWGILNLIKKKNEEGTMEETLHVTPGMYASLAVSCALIRDMKRANKALDRAEELMEDEERFQDEKEQEEIGGGGGGRGEGNSTKMLAITKKKNTLKEIGTKYQRTLQHKTSIAMFARMRDEQAVKDCKRAGEYLSMLNSGMVTNYTSPPATVEESSKVFFLPLNNPKFNYSEAKLPLNFHNIQQRGREEEGEEGEEGGIPGLGLEESRRGKGGKGGKGGRREEDLPIKLEVCSGHGDWVVDRAFHDKGSHWVSLEMRYDRVFTIWSKMIFSEVDNLTVLGGEAHSIFKECIPDSSISEIYVNYPDPPVWKGSSQRLLSKDFLKEVHRVLKPEASVIIVTDDQPYAKMIAEEFAKLNRITPTISSSSTQTKEKIEKENGVVGEDTRSGEDEEEEEPEEKEEDEKEEKEEGAAPAKRIVFFRSAFDAPYINGVPQNYGSSYFDQLWKKGARTKRYTLQYEKVSPSSSSSSSTRRAKSSSGSVMSRQASASLVERSNIRSQRFRTEGEGGRGRGGKEVKKQQKTKNYESDDDDFDLLELLTNQA